MTESPSLIKSNLIALIITAAGLAVQGLSVLTMYGHAIVTGTNGIPNDVSEWMTTNITLITPASLWSLVVVLTIGVFAIGLLGVFWLRSANVRIVRFGAVLVWVSAVFAATTAWGYGLGSLLMLAGSIIMFRGTRSSIRNKSSQ